MGAALRLSARLLTLMTVTDTNDDNVMSSMFMQKYAPATRTALKHLQRVTSV